MYFIKKLKDFPLKINIFLQIIHAKSGASGTRWKKYLSRFDTFLIATGVNDDERKRAMLLHFGGNDLQDVYGSLEIKGNTYEESKTAFTNYFEHTTNEAFEIWNFQRTTQWKVYGIIICGLIMLPSRCNFTDSN